jgi:hypothetical protein
MRIPCRGAQILLSSALAAFTACACCKVSGGGHHWTDCALEGQIAIHISIVDIPAPQEAGAFHNSQIAHAPFEKSAFAASIDSLVATGVAPPRNFEAGYKQWREHNGGSTRCRLYRQSGWDKQPSTTGQFARVCILGFTEERSFISACSVIGGSNESAV